MVQLGKTTSIRQETFHGQVLNIKFDVFHPHPSTKLSLGRRQQSDRRTKSALSSRRGFPPWLTYCLAAGWSRTPCTGSGLCSGRRTTSTVLRTWPPPWWCCPRRRRTSSTGAELCQWSDQWHPEGQGRIPESEDRSLPWLFLSSFPQETVAKVRIPNYLSLSLCLFGYFFVCFLFLIKLPSRSCFLRLLPWKTNLRLSMNAKSLRRLVHLLPSPHLEWGGVSGHELFRRFQAQVGGLRALVSTCEAQRQTPEVSFRHCFRRKQTFVVVVRQYNQERWSSNKLYT